VCAFTDQSAYPITTPIDDAYFFILLTLSQRDCEHRIQHPPPHIPHRLPNASVRMYAYSRRCRVVPSPPCLLFLCSSLGFLSSESCRNPLSGCRAGVLSPSYLSDAIGQLNMLVIHYASNISSSSPEPIITIIRLFLHLPCSTLYTSSNLIYLHFIAVLDRTKNGQKLWSCSSIRQ